MRITLVDSCLRDYNGHHFEYARSVLDECARRGWMGRAVIHRDAPTDLVKRLHAEPVLRHSIYEGIPGPRRGPLGGLCQVVLGNLRYVRDLRRIPARLLRETDLLFFHTINERQIPVIALWFLLAAPARIQTLVLLLRYRAGATARDWSVARLAYRLGLRLLRLSRRTVRLASDTELLAADYERLGGQPVSLYPIPHVPAAAALPRMRSAGQPLIFLMPGHSSLGKGLDIVAAAVASWPADLTDVRLRVQVSNWISGDADRVRQLLATLRACPWVELLEGSPDTETFYRWLQEADVILAPYHPATYGGQTSGIFADAAALGKPIITTPGTWMELQVQHDLADGAVLTTYSAQAFIAACRDLCASFDTHQEKALAASARWRAFHNARTFVDRLSGVTSAP